MGRYLEQYDKDHMRLAMLKQEETFKHQVAELHRLYRAQKLLMNDMKAAEKRRGQRNPYSNSRTKLEWNWSNGDEYSCQDQRRNHRGGLEPGLPSEELYMRGVMLDVDEEEEEEEEEDDECGLELTLATGRRRGRRKESSLASDSGASFSSSSTTARAKFSGSEWGVFHVPDVNYQRERKRAFDAEEPMRGGMVKQPPWLFRCSSLNMT